MVTGLADSELARAAEALATELERFEELTNALQRERLRSTTFIGLLLTQFLGTTNDNILRWLVIGIGKQYVSDSSHVR